MSKQIHISTRKFVALIVCIVVFTASFGIYLTRAVTTSPTAITISSGPYPGAPVYTVWTEAGTYYAKSAFGETIFSNASAQVVIQSCFNGNNVSVFVKAGTYWVTSPIHINYDNCTLYGEGINTVFVSDPTLDDDVFHITGTGQKDVHLREFAIDGNKATQSAGSGIYITTTYVTWDAVIMIDHLHIKNCKEDGIHIEGDTRVCYLSNLNIQMCDGDGIYLAGTDHFLSNIEVGWSGHSGIHTISTSSKFNNIKCFANGQLDVTTDCAGFYLKGPNAACYNVFTDCTAEDNQYNGWCLFSGARDNIFASCWAKNNARATSTWDGWNLTSVGSSGSTYLTTRNVFSGCKSFCTTPYQTNGWALRGGAMNNTISGGCEAYGNSGSGVYILNGSDNLVAGSSFHDNGGVEIVITTGTGNIVTANSGFITNNAGNSASCINGTYFAHGLSGIPTSITLSLRGNIAINSTSWYFYPTVYTMDATYVWIGFFWNHAGTVEPVTAPLAQTVYWDAVYKP